MRKQGKSNCISMLVMIRGVLNKQLPVINDTRNVYLALLKILGVWIITIPNIFKSKIDYVHKQYWEFHLL